jgi:phosphoribosylanthranilate isomerase
MAAVKICGINSPEAFDTAVQAGADWVGFVFYPRSPRYITPPQAAALSARSPGGPARVGLFVGATDADIEATLAEVALDILQLYDPPARAAAIALRFALPVWRSVSVATGAQPSEGGLPESGLPVSAGAAAALLIEPAPPKGATRPGGNAVTLDWSRLRGWEPAFPWLLAGGLTPGNVGQAIAASGATAVDVSSGVETAPGEKSSSLIRAFIEAAKGAKGG